MNVFPIQPCRRRTAWRRSFQLLEAEGHFSVTSPCICQLLLNIKREMPRTKNRVGLLNARIFNSFVQNGSFYSGIFRNSTHLFADKRSIRSCLHRPLHFNPHLRLIDELRYMVIGNDFLLPKIISVPSTKSEHFSNGHSSSLLHPANVTNCFL